jgi:hypothetical protein
MPRWPDLPIAAGIMSSTGHLLHENEPELCRRDRKGAKRHTLAPY